MNINLFIIILFIFFLLFNLKKCKEGFNDWSIYQQNPYQNLYTGSKPLNYYTYNTYRKPLNYPVCHMKDYPLRHCSFFNK